MHQISRWQELKPSNKKKKKLLMSRIFIASLCKWAQQREDRHNLCLFSFKRLTTQNRAQQRSWLRWRMWLLGGTNNRRSANKSQSQGRRGWQKKITLLQKKKHLQLYYNTCLWNKWCMCNVLCGSSVIVYMLSGRKVDGLVQFQPVWLACLNYGMYQYYLH